MEQQRWSWSLFRLVVVTRPETLAEERPGGGDAAGEETPVGKDAFFGDFLFDCAILSISLPRSPLVEVVGKNTHLAMP